MRDNWYENPEIIQSVIITILIVVSIVFLLSLVPPPISFQDDFF